MSFVMSVMDMLDESKIEMGRMGKRKTSVSLQINQEDRGEEEE